MMRGGLKFHKRERGIFDLGFRIYNSENYSHVPLVLYFFEHLYLFLAMNNEIHRYTLRPDLVNKPRELTITPEYIEYKNLRTAASSSLVRIEKDSFVDVKYHAEPIVWYKFTVGYSYRIQIKYNIDKVLTIPMASYFWFNSDYGQIYSAISRHIGNYFLIDWINNAFDNFQDKGVLQMPGLIVRQESVSFEYPDHTMEWKVIGLKEYYRYFAIFDKANPNIHKRVTFDEWNAEVLFNVMKRLISTMGELENNTHDNLQHDSTNNTTDL
jgi:hypothetical protein